MAKPLGTSNAFFFRSAAAYNNDKMKRLDSLSHAERSRAYEAEAIERVPGFSVNVMQSWVAIADMSIVERVRTSCPFNKPRAALVL